MMSDSSSNVISYPRRRKITRRHEAISSSDDSSEDDTPIKRPVRGVRRWVTSSFESSDSSFTEPTRKKVRRAIVESDSTDTSDSSDSEGPVLPRKRKGTILSDNDVTDSEVEVALSSTSTRMPKGDDGSSSDSDGAERCIICFKTLHYPVALPSGCSHQFHEVCLATWSRTSNTCPIDRVKYKYIKITSASGEVLSQRSVTTPPPQVHNDLEPDNPTFCEVCNQHDREAEMLLCDRCEAGYHLDCLDPPLERVPSGDWFCPECSNNEGIEDSEVFELLADSVLLESRLRHRPSVPLRRSGIRNSRLYYARQALQAATNIANNYANSQPSTSAGTSFASSSNSSRKSRSQSRKKSRRKGTTRYKVELVTTEDGTTVEVKLAIKAKGKRKSSSKKKSRKAGRGRYSNRACEREAGSSGLAGSDHHPPSLDIFGSRPTLDYFSGCEAEDEEEVFGQGEVGLLRRGTVARSGLSSRKQIARLLATNQSARPRVVVPSQTAAPSNLLDNILRDQTLWHDPSASIESNSAGEVKVTLPQGRSGCRVRSTATHSGDDRNNSAGRFSNSNGSMYGSQGGTSSGRSHASGSSGGGNSTAGASSETVGSAGGEPSGSAEIPRIPTPPLPPLIPPPEPPLKLCEDDDFDLYADIEPLHAVSKLVPPPEPPPLLLALDTAVDEGGSSPDEGLVIDDQHDTYDPDQPNSPSSPPCGEDEGDVKTSSQEDKVEGVELPDIPLPDAPASSDVRLEDIRLPSPTNEDDSDSEVPISEHYSKASLKLARHSSNSDDEAIGQDSFMDEIIERFRKAPPERVDVHSLKKSDISNESSSSKTVSNNERMDDEDSCESKSNSCSKVELRDDVVSERKDFISTKKVCKSSSDSEGDQCSLKKTLSPKLTKGDENQDISKPEVKMDESDSKDVHSDSQEFDSENDLNVMHGHVESQETQNLISTKNNTEVLDDSNDLSNRCVSPDKEVSHAVKNSNTESRSTAIAPLSKRMSDLSGQMEIECDKMKEKESTSDSEEDDDKEMDEGEKLAQNTPMSEGTTTESSKDDEIKEISSQDREFLKDKSNELNDTEPLDFDSEGDSEKESTEVTHDESDNENISSSRETIESTKELGQIVENGHKSPWSERGSPARRSLSSGEVESDRSGAGSISPRSPEYDDDDDDIDRRKGGKHRRGSHDRDDSWDRESKMSDKDEGQIDTPEREKDVGDGGLVDITDEEISTYEKNWEMENDNEDYNQRGLQGLETEAISESEDGLCEENTPASSNQVKKIVGAKEEGEIITDDRNEFISWKRKTKTSKERVYREKDKENEKESTPDRKKKEKKREKRKELERYDVRKLISDKPKKRKTDEFGRDIASSKSRSSSRDSRLRSEVRRVSDWNKSYRRRSTRSRSVSRGRRRARSVSRSRRRRSSERSKDRIRNRSRSRSRSRGRSLGRSDRSVRKRLDVRSSVRKPDRTDERPDRNKDREKSRDREKRQKSSSSCSTCSCSSCERERMASDKLAVTVPNKATKKGTKKTREKKKDKSRKGKKDNKRRRTDSPVPSKEVFTSGDNILVSVNFRSTSKANKKNSSRRIWEDESRKKKDKENQPARTVIPLLAATQEKDKRKQRRKAASNAKPIAFIDLDPSPFREQILSPTEVIILTDSDNEGKEQGEITHQSMSTGPKTPPEPPVKFSISSKPQLRTLSNPLLETEVEEAEMDNEDPMVTHKGPNTPPEPPETYDPFEPTKSRSPSPRGDIEVGRSGSPRVEISRTPEVGVIVADSKAVGSPVPQMTEPSQQQDPPGYMPIHGGDAGDMDFSPGLGGDSPYSPGSSEGDDLFEPPPMLKSKPARPSALPLPPISTALPSNKHTALKLTPSPLKRRPNAKMSSKKGNSGRKEIGIKLDEDQLKILDELPNSAVEMQVKDKFLKKLNRQERVVEEVKLVLKPHYNKKHVTKEEYKDILRKAVPKICHSRSGEINPKKIQVLIEAYVKKYRHKRKKTLPPGVVPLKPKQQKVLPPILKMMFGTLARPVTQESFNNSNRVTKTKV